MESDEYLEEGPREEGLLCPSLPIFTSSEGHRTEYMISLSSIDTYIHVHIYAPLKQYASRLLSTMFLCALSFPLPALIVSESSLDVEEVFDLSFGVLALSFESHDETVE